MKGRVQSLLLDLCPWTNISISIRICDWLEVCIRSQVNNARYRSGSEDLGRCWTGTGRNNGYGSVRGPKTHQDLSLLRPDAVLIPFYPHLYRFSSQPCSAPLTGAAPRYRYAIGLICCCAVLSSGSIQSTRALFPVYLRC